MWMETWGSLDEARIDHLLNVIDHGLTMGLGGPEPGRMCVEAAVCYAFDWDHNDRPLCVHSDLRDFKVNLNDTYWSSNKARAEGMKELAIAQLGSLDLNVKAFIKQMHKYVLQDFVPNFLLEMHKNYDYSTEEKAKRLFYTAPMYLDSIFDRIYAEYISAYATIFSCANSYYTQSPYLLPDDPDKYLKIGANATVKILEEIGTEGTKWLKYVRSKPSKEIVNGSIT
jgi:hypothetical protein